VHRVRGTTCPSQRRFAPARSVPVASAAGTFERLSRSRPSRPAPARHSQPQCCPADDVRSRAWRRRRQD
jgi:hypothetical protein